MSDRMMPEIRRRTVPGKPCRWPVVLFGNPCPHEAVFTVRWWGGRGGQSPIDRDVCQEHGERWAKQRNLAVPA